MGCAVDVVVKEKMFDMMERHAEALVACDELTLLKVQITDLLDTISGRASGDEIYVALMDAFMSMNVIESRLKMLKIMADMIAEAPNART
jgi:hypothetical protein